MKDVIGINKEQLKALILKIYEYGDKVNVILNDAQLLIDDTKSYYKSDDGDAMRDQFNKFYNEKAEILNNIKSYCSDLNQVILNFEKNQTKIVDIFNK